MPAQRHAMKEEKRGHEHANTPTPAAREIHVQEPPQIAQSSATLRQANNVSFWIGTTTERAHRTRLVSIVITMRIIANKEVQRKVLDPGATAAAIAVWTGGALGTQKTAASILLQANQNCGEGL